MKAYKVTRCSHGSHNSLTHSQMGKVVYAVGRWTTPNEGCGPLAAFKTMEDALHFAATQSIANEHYRLWLCEAQKSAEKGIWMYVPPWRRPVHGEVAKEVKNKDPYIEKNLPEGTVLCSAVKLLKELKWPTNIAMATRVYTRDKSGKLNMVKRVR